MCDEAAHVNDYLMSRCGSNDSNTNLSFRQVLTYQGGVSSKDDNLDQEAIEHLKEILLPAALKVFGEEDNEEAKKVVLNVFYLQTWLKDVTGIHLVFNLHQLSCSWTQYKASS